LGGLIRKPPSISQASREVLGHQQIAPGASNPAPCSCGNTRATGTTVVADGFVWREATYASLSTIARAITGTNWNGPRFFGLRIDKETTVSSDAANASPVAPNGSWHSVPTGGRHRAAKW
jgi:Protein of unknown function (DUF2924)